MVLNILVCDKQTTTAEVPTEKTNFNEHFESILLEETAEHTQREAEGLG